MTDVETAPIEPQLTEEEVIDEILVCIKFHLHTEAFTGNYLRRCAAI